jgi:ABC-type nitrate/sulfonate/bicarbonate transport system permease component
VTVTHPPREAAQAPTTSNWRERIPRPSGPWRIQLGFAARAAIGWVGLLVLWELLARQVLDGTRLIAAPTAIVGAIVDNAALYGRAFRVTGYEALMGYLWGNLAAILLAAVVAVLPISERFVLRLALVVFCLPLVALGPVLRLVFGLGEGPQITLSALAVYYTTLVPLLVGLRAVPAGWLDLVRSYGRGRVTALRVVRARACVPYLMSGLQIGVPAAFLGALVGEFTGAERGVGILTILALRSLDTDGLWALATLSAAVSVIGYVFVGAIGRWMSSGQPPVILSPPPPSGRAPSAVSRVVRGLWEAAWMTAVVIALWALLFWAFQLNSYFAKTPLDVWRWLVTGPDADAHRAEVFGALASTAAFALPGYLAGLLLGVALAAVFELSASVRRTVTPVAVALRCVPIVAIAPLLVQALGRGAVGTMTVVALMTFFPTLVACMYGLRQTPGQVDDFFRTFDVPRWRFLLLAQIPAMAPAFFSAARIACPAAILAATVAEWLATGTGIGNLMAVAAGTSVYGTLWACVVVVTVAAVLFYWVVEVVERAVLSRVAPEQVSW